MYDPTCGNPLHTKLCMMLYWVALLTLQAPGYNWVARAMQESDPEWDGKCGHRIPLNRQSVRLLE